MLRAFFSVPCHAIAAGFIGDLAARRRFDGTGPGLLGGFLVTRLHGRIEAWKWSLGLLAIFALYSVLR